jgi:glutathione S-transferase
LAETYQLFHYESCPYCARVRRFLSGAGLEIALRDVQREPGARAELIAGGGRPTVPCLRIEREDGSVQWLYESVRIIEFLERHAQRPDCSEGDRASRAR